MIKIEIIIGYALYRMIHISTYCFQGPIIPNREYQCTSFEPLVDHFGYGPPTYGQPGLSGLVVGSQKRYKNHGPANPKLNTCQDPAKTQ